MWVGLDVNDKTLANTIQGNRSGGSLEENAGSCGQNSPHAFENDGDSKAKGVKEKAGQAGILTARDRMKASVLAEGSRLTKFVWSGLALPDALPRRAPA